MRRTAAVVAALFLLVAAGCSESQPDAQKQETARQQSSYEKLTAGQPAKSMSYSPSRETINFWIETWDKPNKLAYVYLQASNGQLVGYYVFKGLPVSYCASLTPTYRLVDTTGDGDGYPDFEVPAPAMDGVYYSGAGSCNTYYGQDATTGEYMEYTVGTGISALLFERPMPRQDVEPLGFTTVEDVE